MAKQILTDAIIRDLPAPKAGMTIVRDIKVSGLGVRILPASKRDPNGTRAFILDYSFGGRRRIFTIGKFPDWKLTRAREKAKEIQTRIRHQGFDPAEELKEARAAPTVNELAQALEKDHFYKLRDSTRNGYKRMLTNDILPVLGNRKVASIQFEDISALHRKITARESPAQANAVVAVCSKLFSHAIKLRQINHSPAKGVERNFIPPRERYLSSDEIVRLTDALAAYRDQDVADLLRLMLLTGARRGETQSATWEQINFDEAKWVKPGHATKQKRTHHLPLAAPARLLLIGRRAKADAILAELDAEIAKAPPCERQKLEKWQERVEKYVFPAKVGNTGHLVEPKRAWVAICKAAGIIIRQKITDEKGQTKIVIKKGARMHDLRHTSASVLANAGATLQVIGSVLDHSQIQTTQRYAHLFPDTVKGAVEKLGAAITGADTSAEIVSLADRRK